MSGKCPAQCLGCKRDPCISVPSTVTMGHGWPCARVTMGAPLSLWVQAAVHVTLAAYRGCLDVGVLPVDIGTTSNRIQMKQPAVEENERPGSVAARGR